MTSSAAQAQLTKLVPIPDRINIGVAPSGNRLMLSALGNPRSSYTRDCAPVTNKAFAGRIVTRDVGPFRVTGFAPAVDSLGEIFADVQREQIDVYRALGSAGMLCARLVRGSNSAISNHSWGTAIDLTLAGQLDAPGNGRVQHGLTLIAPIFNRRGWFWGAGFRREDAMHFECGRALVEEFAGMKTVPGALDMLDLGDRGPAVAELQRLLNAQGEDLSTDGIFGPGTRAALVAFQAANGLKPDGVAGPRTLAKLREKKP